MQIPQTAPPCKLCVQHQIGFFLHPPSKLQLTTENRTAVFHSSIKTFCECLVSRTPPPPLTNQSIIGEGDVAPGPLTPPYVYNIYIIYTRITLVGVPPPLLPPWLRLCSKEHMHTITTLMFSNLFIKI